MFFVIGSRRNGGRGITKAKHSNKKTLVRRRSKMEDEEKERKEDEGKTQKMGEKK